MSTITVSIGRNVGSVPLPVSAWDAFRWDVDHEIRAYCGTVYVSDAVCVGEWDGITEESRTWVAAWDLPYAPGPLVNRLAILAGRYGQDAIAVTTGTTVLAGLQPVTV